jgi:hypothetical protein
MCGERLSTGARRGAPGDAPRAFGGVDSHGKDLSHAVGRVSALGLLANSVIFPFYHRWHGCGGGMLCDADADAGGRKYAVRRGRGARGVGMRTLPARKARAASGDLGGITKSVKEGFQQWGNFFGTTWVRDHLTLPPSPRLRRAPPSPSGTNRLRRFCRAARRRGVQCAAWPNCHFSFRNGLRVS